MDQPTISVIIPSVGRDSLVRAVRSALDQNIPTEVLIADDSGQGRVEERLRRAPDMTAAREDGRVTVLPTGGGARASGGRTLAMSHARGRYAAFLDDDDMFLSGHLTTAVRWLSSVPAPAVYACRAVVRSSRGGRVEPAVLVENGKVSEYLFADSAWRSRSRIVSTSTVVFTADLLEEPMVYTDKWAQDTCWLLAAEQRGARLHVDPFIGVERESGEVRDGQRARTRDRSAWAAEVARRTTGRRAAAMLVGKHGRDAAREGDPGKMLSLYRESRAYDRSPRWLVAAALQTVVAAGIKGTRMIRDRGARG